MSLPVPSVGAGGRGGAGSDDDDEATALLDAPLIALTQRCDGDLRKVLRAFFGFLHRRTDFYVVPHPDDIAAGRQAAFAMGFREGDAEKALVAAFRQFPLRRMPPASARAAATASQEPTSLPSPPTPKHGKNVTNHDKAVGTQTPKPTKDTSENTGSASGSNVVPKKSEPEHKDSKEQSHPQSKESQTEATEAAAAGKTSSNKSGGAFEGVRYTEEGLQVPVGNGGTTSRYTWTQTIDECSVIVAVPEGCRGKDLSVTIKPAWLSVRSKKPLFEEDGIDPHVFLEGALAEQVVPDESTWSLEGGAMVVILYKRPKTFWKTVLDGDDQIDASLVDSRRHVDEYDDATQAQIRKCIFDQSQSRKGLPTSDEILGKNPGRIPILPQGVEYIDQSIMDKQQPKPDGGDRGKNG